MGVENFDKNRIVINPNVMVGKPTVRGMRITVDQLLKSLSNGLSEDSLLEEYPELEKEDFQAIYSYAAGVVEEERVIIIDTKSILHQ